MTCKTCEDWGIRPDGCPDCGRHHHHADRCRCEKLDSAWGSCGFHWHYKGWKSGVQTPANLPGPATAYGRCPAYSAAVQSKRKP